MHTNISVNADIFLQKVLNPYVVCWCFLCSGQWYYSPTPQMWYGAQY